MSKPFNLERALAGDPVETRDGRPVFSPHYFKERTGILRLWGVVEGELEGWYDDGTARLDETLDLFMSTTKKKWWIWIGDKSSTTSRDTSRIYETREECEQKVKHLPIADGIFVPVEWEE